MKINDYPLPRNVKSGTPVKYAAGKKKICKCRKRYNNRYYMGTEWTNCAADYMVSKCFEV